MGMLSEKEQKMIDLVVVYKLAPNHLTCGFRRFRERELPASFRIFIIIHTTQLRTQPEN